MCKSQLVDLHLVHRRAHGGGFRRLFSETMKRRWYVPQSRTQSLHIQKQQQAAQRDSGSYQSMYNLSIVEQVCSRGWSGGSAGGVQAFSWVNAKDVATPTWRNGYDHISKPQNHCMCKLPTNEDLRFETSGTLMRRRDLAESTAPHIPKIWLYTLSGCVTPFMSGTSASDWTIARCQGVSRTAR